MRAKDWRQANGGYLVNISRLCPGMVLKKNYIVGRQKDMDQPLHDGNIEYAMFNYTTDKKGCERLAEQYNRTGFQGLEKEKFAGV